MLKRVRWIIVSLVFILLGGILYFITAGRKANPQGLAGLPGPGSQGERVLHVHVEVLDTHPMTDYTITTGDILPAEEVNLTFEISGKVVEICFNEGEFVKKGTVLARINDAPLQAQLKKLESQVKLAQDRVYRQQALLEKDAVSREAFESVQTDYNKLMADIELVKA